MDRRQLLVQRARDYFTDRLDDVLHMVLQDRQELKGWQEPAHLRAAVRRTIREENGSTTFSTVTAPSVTRPDSYTFEVGRPAGEPDRGQQREAIGMLLEAGASALNRIIRNNTDLTGDEAFGLEAVLLFYGRPALALNDAQPPGREGDTDRHNITTFDAVPPFWNVLEDQREDIEMTQSGVGRIELLGHPDLDWAGTGFLVTENLLLTTRRTAELFSEGQPGSFRFRPGISAWMDYRPGYQNVSTAGCRVRNVVDIHPNYDLAILEVENLPANGDSPLPLPLLGNPASVFGTTNLQNRQVYLVGYPIRDARRNEPEIVSRIFRDVYNAKRVQPGIFRGEFRFGDIGFFTHDAAPLGITSGSPIVDLETHLVVGVQLSGRYLENGTAIPLYNLREDPFFRRNNIPFCEGARRRLTDRTVEQLQRLARTRYWNEVQGAIDQIYRRAFGR